MSRPLSGKTIVVGITGSIAAYKGAEVARRLWTSVQTCTPR